MSMSVCLSVRENISGTAGAIFTQMFVHVVYGRGSVLFRRRCDKLCTSGFMDDKMFLSIMCRIAVWKTDVVQIYLFTVKSDRIQFTGIK